MDNKIVERVRKLLAMAKDSSSPNEAAIAARRASKLMEQHNLQQADILLNQDFTDRITSHTSDRGYGMVPRWYAILLVPVAKVYDCEVRYIFDGNKKKPQFLGMDEDVLVASYVLEYLAGEIERLAKKHRKECGADRIAMNDFRNGASQAIVSMLNVMIKEKQQQTSKGTELVLCKQNMIAQKFGREVGKYKQSSRRTRSSIHHELGKRAGSKVSIRRGVESSGQSRVE